MCNLIKRLALRRGTRRTTHDTEPTIAPKQEAGTEARNTCPCGRYRLHEIPVLNWDCPSVFVEGIWRVENLGAVTSAEMARWSLGLQSTCVDPDCPAFRTGERCGPSIVPASGDATAKSSKGDLVG